MHDSASLAEIVQDFDWFGAGMAWALCLQEQGEAVSQGAGAIRWISRLGI